MDIRDIKAGDKLFVKSLNHTRKAHGLNDIMKRRLGKFIRVDGVSYDCVTAIGYTWNAKDFCLDEPNPIESVPLTGDSVKFNPESL